MSLIDLAKYGYSKFVDEISANPDLPRNAESFKKRTKLKKILWTYAQGAMLGVCIDETGKPIEDAIQEIRIGDLSKNYQNLREKLNEKVDELLFDENREDGLNQEIIQKPLVVEFSKCFSGYWKQRVKNAKSKVAQVLNLAV